MDCGKEESSSYFRDLCTYFENYQDAVFIMDADTLTVCYMNRVAKKHFHLKPAESYENRHCYDLFEERLSQCDHCVHLAHLPEPGQFYYWSSKLHDSKSAYRMKDTQIVADGHRYLLEIIQPLDYDMAVEKTLRSMSDNEHIINEAIELAMNEPDPDHAIYLAVAHIGERLSCDRAYIFEENKRGSFDNTYEWCAPGITREKDNLQDCPYSVIQVWYDEFDKHNNVMITDLEEYRHTSEAMYQYLKPQDIHTLEVAPLVLDNHRIGFYGVDNPPVEAMDNIAIMFEVLGHFLAAMIRHRENVIKLEQMGTYDQMTGLLNRNDLESVLAGIDKDSSIAYIFCDLNGLKRVNDKEGHDAGDDLIKHTAHVLRRMFPEENVFRMGGDEFLILITDIGKKEAKKRTDALRRAFEDEGIHAAIGMLWRPKANENFDELYAKVDSLMYEDKMAWYGDRRKHKDK